MATENKIKPVPGKWVVYRIVDYDVFIGYVKAVTLSGNCYCEGSFETIKKHQIIDVVDTVEEYREKKKAGEYRLCK